MGRRAIHTKDLIAQLERMPAEYWPICRDAIWIIQRVETLSDGPTLAAQRETIKLLFAEKEDLRHALEVMSREYYAALSGRDLKADAALVWEVEDLEETVKDLKREVVTLKQRLAKKETLKAAC